MNAWSFFSTLIWQALLFVVLWSFREPIIRLLDRLRSFEGFGLKALFDELRDLAGEVAAEPETAVVQRFQVEAARSPRRAILDSWEEIYNSLRDLVWKRKREKPPRTYRGLGSKVRAEKLLTDDVSDVIDQLKNIYRSVRDLPESAITHDQGQQYVRTASIAIGAISAAIDSNPE